MSIPCPQVRPPIDLAHLREATGVDEGLMREVLGLFVSQAQALGPRLKAGDARAAHTLKGAARGIGAFAAADAIEAAERSPDPSPALLALACSAVAMAEHEAARLCAPSERL